MSAESIIAMLIQNGSSILGQFIRSRPVEVSPPQNSRFTSNYLGDTGQTTPQEPPATESFKSYANQTDKDYRFECCTKHLSTASGILKEATDRCIGNGFDVGVREKIREAMSTLNAMEADLAAMNGIPEISDDVRLLSDGLRKLRKAVWSAKLETTGSGTPKADLSNVESTLRWSRQLLNNAYEFAQKHQGGSCMLKI